MYRIKTINRDNSGNIFAYTLDDGRLISPSDAFILAKEGRIHNYITGVNENGEKTIHNISYF